MQLRMKIDVRTASLAFRASSSVFALFRVPTRRPNILLPRLRSLGPIVRSNLGRFFGAAAAAAVA